MRYLKSITLLILLLASVHFVAAQEYRVIVGGFSNEENAKRLTSKIKSEHPTVRYSFNPDRNLYYVIALSTSNKQEALNLTLQLQKGQFKDAWFYYCAICVPEEGRAVVETQPVNPPELQPLPQPNNPDRTAESQQPEPTSEEVKEEEKTVEEPATVVTEPIKPKGKFVVFSIVDPNGQPVSGEVHFVDRNTQKDYATYKANTKVDVLPPNQLRNEMPILCALFGYKEQTHFFDYDDPSKTPGASQDADGVWTVPYQLELLEKKDVSVMYKVSFHKDAVVMLPQSKSELDQLVSLMQLNPNYEIKIHGHTNGKNRRKIIALGDNNNFFSVEGSKTFTGSSKELSELRAKAVQLYLTQNGVDEKRTKIYGWGFTLPLVPENSPSAPKLNDRIEIEILGD